MARTKIIATIGPSSNPVEILTKLRQAGMSVARLNMSHGTYPEHEQTIKNIYRVDPSLAILVDLQGPKIRTGSLKEKEVFLKTGARFIITNKEIAGDSNVVSTTYACLAKDVKAGDRILLGDGLIELKVLETTDTDVIAEVQNDGILGEHKGINLPGIKISAPCLTEKDGKDLNFAIKQKVDYVAISFVRRAQDVLEVKEIIKKQKAEIPVIAKIEKPEALENIDAIIDIADGIMIARGDLGVEMAPEKVPLIQKMIIAKCCNQGKLVITATQMLESMVEHPRPTRAEASDVANAVFDGTDVLMLSEETAMGKYPVEAVAMMARIAQEVETELFIKGYPTQMEPTALTTSIQAAVSHAAKHLSEDVRAKAIITFTSSGSTARLVSKFRPAARIFAGVIDEKIIRRLQLYWGVSPIRIDRFINTDDMVRKAEEAITRAGLLQKDDVVVIAAGVPVGLAGTTNLIKVHRIGEAVDFEGLKR